MGKLLSYSIISGLIMLAMYLVYKLFIARENQHGFNRGVLLVIYLVSFCAYPLYNCFYTLTADSTIMPSVNLVGLNDMTLEPTSFPLWGTILIWIFIFGALIVTIRTVITWIRIVLVIHSGEKIKKDGFTVVVIDNDKIAPFSWMRNVVICRNDLYNNYAAVIEHELEHIRSLHWIDLLIAQALCIINWFNPAAWLMRDELMLVHEYQADMAVIDNGHNPQEYQMLLIKKAVGRRFPSLANSINHSKLKKRITMMYKSKSGAGSKLKALALVPMVALALGVAQVPAVKAAVSTISNSDVSLSKGSENLADAKLKISSLNNSGVETTVVVIGEGFGNSLSVSGATFMNNGIAYPAQSLNTNMTDGDVSIVAVFPFSDKYENANVALIINGQEVKLNLDEFRSNSQSNSVSISPSNGIVISQSQVPLTKGWSQIQGESAIDMDIYLDGKKISEEDMNSLNPKEIASVTVDQQNKTIWIITK